LEEEILRLQDQLDAAADDVNEKDWTIRHLEDDMVMLRRSYGAPSPADPNRPYIASASQKSETTAAHTAPSASAASDDEYGTSIARQNSHDRDMSPGHSPGGYGARDAPERGGGGGGGSRSPKNKKKSGVLSPDRRRSSPPHIRRKSNGGKLLSKNKSGSGRFGGGSTSPSGRLSPAPRSAIHMRHIYSTESLLAMKKAEMMQENRRREAQISGSAGGDSVGDRSRSDHDMDMDGIGHRGTHDSESLTTSNPDGLNGSVGGINEESPNPSERIHMNMHMQMHTQGATSEEDHDSRAPMDGGGSHRSSAGSGKRSLTLEVDVNGGGDAGKEHQRSRSPNSVMRYSLNLQQRLQQRLQGMKDPGSGHRSSMSSSESVSRDLSQAQHRPALSPDGVLKTLSGDDLDLDSTDAKFNFSPYTPTSSMAGSGAVAGVEVHRRGAPDKVLYCTSHCDDCN